MKKVLLLALTAIVMAGCAGEATDGHATIRTVVIDSCEYIQFTLGYDFSHKGNCRYCAERRKQELKELIKEVREK